MDYSRYDGFEVDGRNIKNITDVFRLFKDLPMRVFAAHGIGLMKADQLVLEPDKWYPMTPWLMGMHEISDRVGPAKMFDMGKQVPKNSPFPPTITDIYSALGSVDVAYHMNHRKKNGPVMFDFDGKGGIMEGIGHYIARLERGKHRIEVESNDVPYPCDLDRGIVAALALKFEPNATIVHADGSCRREGGDRCVYVITW